MENPPVREHPVPEMLPPKAMAAPDPFGWLTLPQRQVDEARGMVKPLRTYHAATRQNIMDGGLEVRTYMLPSGRLVEVRTVMEMQR